MTTLLSREMFFHHSWIESLFLFSKVLVRKYANFNHSFDCLDKWLQKHSYEKIPDDTIF